MEEFIEQRTLEGTVLKMIINFGYPADRTVTLDSIDFSVDFYCSTKKVVHFEKEDLMRIEETDGSVNYYAAVNTADVGAGYLKMRMVADILDTDIEGAYRREVVSCGTNVFIDEDKIVGSNGQ